MTRKVRVQLVQLSSSYGNQHYIPYSVGVLTAFAQQSPEIADHFEFRPFLFSRESVSRLVDCVGQVDILGLSSYIWNWRLNLALAQEIRRKNPSCLIVVGGPQVPDRLDDFFVRHPFIDIAVHGEAEITFQELLKTYAAGGALRHIQGLSFHDRTTGEVNQNSKRERITDLDTIPSPYLSGVFDHLLQSNTAGEWNAMWETNRGCPYSCTFCDWGSSIATKMRLFSMERLHAEINWFADHKVGWILGADSNFGILKRDHELADALARSKKQTGFPRTFRVCFAKNSNEKVYQLAKILHDADMSKGVSLSMQSLSEEALKNIKRGNIKLSDYQALQARYMQEGIATYTELIIGLPGETYASFVRGLDQLLEQGQHSGLNIYNCSVMPNAEFGDPAYQAKYGIRFVEQPIFQAHSSRPADDDTVVEFEPIVIETNTLPVKDWRRTYHFAWAVQCFHLLGMLQAVAIFLRARFEVSYADFYQGLLDYGCAHASSLLHAEMDCLDRVLDDVLSGKGFNQFLSEFQDINWPVEEASHLRLSLRLDAFYQECAEFLGEFIEKKGISLSPKQMEDLIRYQKSIIVHFSRNQDDVIAVGCNLHEYIHGWRIGRPVSFQEGSFAYRILVRKSFNGDLQRFAREIVWFGRKGGKFLYPVEPASVPIMAGPIQVPTLDDPAV